jgi:uncharacterized protein (TIGR00297 family)
LNILFQHEYFLLNFLVGIFLAIVISIFSYRLRLLTKTGTAAIFILAVLIYGFGGWKFTLPIFIFFISSSLLSKFRKKRNATVETYFEKSGERDHYQVFANGGVAGLFVVLNYFYPSELLYIVYVSILAAVCADTWATEIGTLSGNKTFDILTFKKVEQGVSGGISFNGTLGSFVGALIIASTSLLWIQSDYLPVLLIISFAGLFGSLTDSLVGSAFQAQYNCKVCNRITERKEHCSELSELHKGIYWVNNDVVNAGSGVSGGVFSILLVDVFRI